MEINNKKYIPALRFPEFQNDGEWKCIIIGNIINTINPPKKLQSSEYKKKGTFPIVDQSSSYISGYSDDVDAVIDCNGHKYIVFGDHTCSLKLVDFPFIQGADGIKIFKSKTPEVLTEHLYQYIFAHPIISKEYKRHFSDLKEKLLLYSANVCEQKKVADCLSSLDKYIDAIKRKLELLKEHKRGLMQRLFPAKGKTTPELRFPEFIGTKEWTPKQLGDIGETLGGLSGKSAEDFGTGKPFVTYKQVFNSSEIDSSECALVQVSENETQNKLQYGDVLVTMSSETPDEVGYTAVVTNKNIPECYLNSFCFIYRLFDNESIDARFLIYLFNSDVYRTAVVRIAQGITRFNISKTKFKEIELAIPENKNEQIKIAETLSAIDKQIEEYDKKIKALELHKKGLMQQLFPKL